MTSSSAISVDLEASEIRPRGKQLDFHKILLCSRPKPDERLVKNI